MSPLTSDDRSFSVGEIAILQMCDNPENNGKETLILATPKPSEWVFTDHRGKEWWIKPDRYVTENDGGIWSTHPYKLRKKRPPREPLGDWELIPWKRPTQVKYGY